MTFEKQMNLKRKLFFNSFCIQASAPRCLPERWPFKSNNHGIWLRLCRESIIQSKVR